MGLCAWAAAGSNGVRCKLEMGVFEETQNALELHIAAGEEARAP